VGIKINPENLVMMGFSGFFELSSRANTLGKNNRLFSRFIVIYTYFLSFLQKGLTAGKIHVILK